MSSKVILSAIFSCLMLSLTAVSAEEAYVIGNFTSAEEASSYALGLTVGRNFHKDGFKVNQKVFENGLTDGLMGNKPRLSEDEIKSIMRGVQGELRRNTASSRAQQHYINQNKSEKFLAENAKQDGVVSLPSGVQYIVLKQGNGKQPLVNDTVEVKYRGTRIDSTAFDSTPENQSAKLKVEQLIAGWKEALLLMPVGSKWQLFIPSKLAYGEDGVAGKIGPNEALVFEVELLAIE